jgi:hypothetical protein
MTKTAKTKEAINASFEANARLKATIVEIINSWTGMVMEFNFRTLYSQRDAYFISNNIAEQMTPRLFDSATVDVCVWLRKDGDIACEVKYSYQHFDGGTNGMKLGAMTISKDGKKIIEQETVQARTKRIKEEDAELKAYWKAQSVVEAFEKKHSVK